MKKALLILFLFLFLSALPGCRESSDTPLATESLPQTAAETVPPREMFPRQAAIEPTILASHSSVFVTAQSLTYPDGHPLLTLLVENDSRKDFAFDPTGLIDQQKINGMVTNLDWYTTENLYTIPAGQSLEIPIPLNNALLAMLGVQEIESLEFGYTLVEMKNGQYTFNQFNGSWYLETSAYDGPDHLVNTWQDALNSNFGDARFGTRVLHVFEEVAQGPLLSAALVEMPNGYPEFLLFFQNDTQEDLTISTDLMKVNDLTNVYMSGFGGIELPAGSCFLLQNDLSSVMEYYKLKEILPEIGKIELTYTLTDGESTSRDLLLTLPGAANTPDFTGDVLYNAQNLRIAAKGMKEYGNSKGAGKHFLLLAENTGETSLRLAAPENAPYTMSIWGVAPGQYGIAQLQFPEESYPSGKGIPAQVTVNICNADNQVIDSFLVPLN